MSSACIDELAVVTDVSTAQADSPAAACSRIPGGYWAVVWTYAQAEQWAVQNLEQRGYPVFLPTYLASVPDKATPSLRHEVIRPLFSRYAFVALGPSDPWTPVRYCPGVARLLMRAGRPDAARAASVAALQAGEAARCTRAAARRTAPTWRPGEACLVAGGPLDGQEAAVVSVGRGKVTVAVMMFGALREASVAADALVRR